MKTIEVFFKKLNREIIFHIGQNKNENFDVIDIGKQTDLWFHSNNNPSCHVVAIIPEYIEKKDLIQIIKTGALLCKSNTNKLKSMTNVEIIYSQIKHLRKTSIPGCVEILNKKIIKI